MKNTKEQVDAMTSLLEGRQLLQPLTDICASFHITIQDVLWGSRMRTVVRARDACLQYVLSLGFSLTESGNMFGMDHTSVMCSRDRSRKRSLIPMELPDGPAPAPETDLPGH